MIDNRIHIHIENSRSSAPVFIASQEQVDALLGRNEDIRDRLHITMGSSAFDETERWTSEDSDEYYMHMKTADVLVGYSFPTERVASYAPALKFVHFISSGVEHISPFGWVSEGLQLVNNRGVHLPKSGESFAMFLAMLNAQIPRLVTSQHAHKWDRVFTSVIAGKKLAVLGVGCQGGEIARRARDMGMDVTGIDPYVTAHPCCRGVLPMSDMEEALRGADFLAIAAPLTDETKGVIGRRELDFLPHHAGVMNISRGPLLNQEALVEKLCAGELSGAVLDVFDMEPLPEDSPLWETPNLIITPHVSSDDLINYMPLTLDLTVQNVRNHMNNRPLVNIVDVHREF